jgi:uncharacterized protein YceH (UPF0502 family)
MTREDGPFIARQPKAAGARESRYAHLFSGFLESAPEPDEDGLEAGRAAAGTPTIAERVRALEDLVEQLRLKVDALTSTG